MFCRICGQSHYAEDNFCIKCGSKIKTGPTDALPGDPIETQLPDQPEKHTKPSDIVLPEGGLDLKQYLEEIEISILKKALSKTNGIKNKAAALLRLNRTTLVEKIKKHAIKA
jgi:transcriptional regulator with PAS, ATPase and Fis domain